MKVVVQRAGDMQRDESQQHIDQDVVDVACLAGPKAEQQGKGGKVMIPSS
ncbi:MAG: hypothetical protein U1E93_03780 [Alphaproteobacteria bacterium]